MSVLNVDQWLIEDYVKTRVCALERYCTPEVLKERKPRLVAYLHVRTIDFDDRLTSRAKRTLRQRVANLQEIVIDARCRDVEFPAAELRERSVRIVVELPLKFQRIAVELVARAARRDFREVSGIWRFALHLHNRPVVFPLHRENERHAPDAAPVTEKDSHPRAVSFLYKVTLRDSLALESNVRFDKRPFDRLCAMHVYETAFAARPADVDKIVPVTALEDLAALGESASEVVADVRAHELLAGLDAAEVVLDAVKVHLSAGASEEPELAVLYPQRVVVDKAIGVDMTLPRARHVLGAEEIRVARGVVEGRDVETAVGIVIADRRRPCAVPVVVTAFETVLRTILDRVVAVTGYFPIHKILGGHNRYAGVEVHGS